MKEKWGSREEEAGRETKGKKKGDEEVKTVKKG
jgi:hypothetical protein